MRIWMTLCRKLRGRRGPIPVLVGREGRMQTGVGHACPQRTRIILKEPEFCLTGRHFTNVFLVDPPRQVHMRWLLKCRFLRHTPEALIHRVCIFSSIMDNFNAPWSLRNAAVADESHWRVPVDFALVCAYCYYITRTCGLCQPQSSCPSSSHPRSNHCYSSFRCLSKYAWCPVICLLALGFTPCLLLLSPAFPSSCCLFLKFGQEEALESDWRAEGGMLRESGSPLPPLPLSTIPGTLWLYGASSCSASHWPSSEQVALALEF